MPDIDPILEQDLTGTDIRDQILPKGNYKVEVVNVEQRQSDGGTNMLRVLTKTLDPHSDVDGRPVSVGHLLNQTIFLTPNEYNTVDDITKELKKFMVGLGVSAGQIAPLDQWKGKAGTARVTIQKANERFPNPSNKITGWIS